MSSLLMGANLSADFYNTGPMGINGPFFMGSGSNFGNSGSNAHAMFQNPISGDGSYSVTSWQNLNGATIDFQSTTTFITLTLTGPNDSIFDGIIKMVDGAAGSRIIKQNAATNVAFKTTLDSSNWKGIFELAAGSAVIENQLYATIEMSGSNTLLDVSTTNLLSALTVNTGISTTLNIGSKLNGDALHVDNLIIQDNTSILFDADLSLLDINPGDLLVFLSADISTFGENLFFDDTDLTYKGAELLGEWITENNQVAFRVSEIPEASTYAAFLGLSIFAYSVIRRRRK